MTDVERLHDLVDAAAERMVEALRGCLRIPSTKGAPEQGAPFGPDVRRALDYTLGVARDLGFSVKDVDGYAGHAEFGTGAEMVAAFGHIDVVPAGEGWRHDPFGADVEGEWVYARGSSDDKGPTCAALFAAKALMDSGLPLRRRVRVIFGCDEESGFHCLKHYWGEAGEERPVAGFTPDASFPAIYAEKGIATLVLERPVEDVDAPARVVRARAGSRANVVPDRAEARIEGEPAALYRVVVRLGSHWDRNVSVDADDAGITVSAGGRAAHGAAPQAGDNAIARLCRALLGAGLTRDARWLRAVLSTCDPVGTGLGVAGADDVTGALSSNAAILEMDGAVVRMRYNVRYPVTWTVEDVVSRLSAPGWILASHTDDPPLHVPQDAEPLRTLLRVYREETGDETSRPGTMGGGTYARLTPNTVAFGARFPGSTDGPPHQAEERASIPNLIRAAKVYAHALYELAR